MEYLFGLNNVLKKSEVTLQLLYKGPVNEDSLWKSKSNADVEEILWYEMPYHGMDHW